MDENKNFGLFGTENSVGHTLPYIKNSSLVKNKGFLTSVTYCTINHVLQVKQQWVRIAVYSIFASDVRVSENDPSFHRKVQA